MEQEKVWDNISEEWNRFKTNPSESATEFLNKSSGKIVDFGSGSGRNLLNIENFSNKEFYLIDFSQRMLDFAKKRFKDKVITTKSNLEKTGFPDNFFDAGIFVASLHCIKTSKKRENSLREFFRVLKPSAKAEIEVWNKNSDRFKKSPKEKFISWRDKGKRYYYLYDKKELKNLLERVGFEILEEKPHNANLIFIVEKSNN